MTCIFYNLASNKTNQQTTSIVKICYIKKKMAHNAEWLKNSSYK